MRAPKEFGGSNATTRKHTDKTFSTCRKNAFSRLLPHLTRASVLPILDQKRFSSSVTRTKLNPHSLTHSEANSPNLGRDRRPGDPSDHGGK
eukprot:4635392-Amphidinium_carterae.1